MSPQQGLAVVEVLGIFIILYFLMIRPQQIQQKRYREMIAKLKKGTRVLTTGGLYGVVVEIKDNQILLEFAQNVRVWGDRTAVRTVVTKGGTAG